MVSAVLGGPLWKGGDLLDDSSDRVFQILMSGMAHDNRSDMLFFVGLMVHAWPFEGFFMFFYFALVVILYK